MIYAVSRRQESEGLHEEMVVDPKCCTGDLCPAEQLVLLRDCGRFSAHCGQAGWRQSIVVENGHSTRAKDSPLRTHVVLDGRIAIGQRPVLLVLVVSPHREENGLCGLVEVAWETRDHL